MRRALAGLLSGALIAAAAVVGVPAAANAAEAAAVTLPEVPREGATVAISGSGFDASGFGIYLSVRSNADSSDSFTVWIDDTNEVGELPGLGGTAPMTPEGSFTVDVPIPAYSEAGYTIVTRGAHGIPNPANNTSTPVVFLPAPAEATTTVLTSPAGSSAVDGTAIDLTATVSPAAAGSVTLSYGATTVGTAGVVGGVAGFSDVVLPVGVHTLTASFVPEDSAAFLPSAGELVFEVTAVEVPEEPVWVPAIEVFLADGVTPYTGQPVYTDDVLVVKGTGFDPEANVGGRGVPIPNTLPQGTYVVFGSFLDEWQPSSGAASSSRKAFGQKWVLAEAVLDQVPDRYQSAIRGQWAELSEDGSFEAELTVSDFESGLAGGNWGVYSYGAGGVANADQELSVAIDYRGERPVAPVFEPAIEVFLADGVTPYTGQPVYTDDVLVVKGTGFDPEANVGGRGVPIPNTLPQGTYVVFGSFLDEWQPSSGAASSSRKAFGQKWVLAEAVLDQVPDRYQSAIRGQWAELSEDGSFEAELTVSDFESGLAGGNWGVYSYGAGGVANADQELSVAIDYRGERPVAPVFEPAIEVFLADGVTPYTGQPVSEGDQLVVKGTGFDPAANVGGSGVPIPSTLPQGTFIVFGSFADEWQPSTGAASSTRTINADSRVWALAEDVLEQVPPAFQSIIKSAWAPIAEDGSFTATVTLKAPTAPLADGNWGVYTYPGGVGAPANPEQELSVLVNFTASTPEEPEEPSGPKVTVTPDADLDPTVENTLTITGTGFTGPSAANGAYVLFGESSVWSGGSPLPGEGWLVQGWVMPREIVDGAFTTTLTIPANTLDPTKSYQVATSAAHGLSATDRTLDTFTPVTVGEPGTGGPAIGLSAPSVAQGSGLTVRGTGFPAGGKVTVTVGSTPIVLGSADADAEGAFEVSGVIPATFAPGAHTVTAVSGDVSVSLPLTVTAVVVVPTEPVPPAEPVCVAREVSGATFEWGVKASFRSYIEGSIAKGSYDIGWGYGSGSYNTDENRGRVGFGGSAHFTGHGGQLDLTISNPRVQIYSSGSAVLIANVSSKGYASNPGIDANGVALANLSLPAASVSGDTIAWYGASATLTEAGAAAFSGFYSAGDALDPVSFTFPLGGEVPCDATTSGELAATGGESESGAIWIGFVLIALGAALVVARRRAQHA